MHSQGLHRSARWVLLSLASCASVPEPDELPGPRPLGRDLPVYRASLETDEAPPVHATPRPAGGPLALRDALALALAGNPGLAAYSWETRAAEARALQAGALDNPELGIELEDFGGRRDLAGLDGAQATIRLSQLVDLGGQAGARSRAARYERDLAGWDYETKRLDVFAETAAAFIDVLAAQERATLWTELVALAEEGVRTAETRVESGKAPPLEALRARADLASARVRLDRSSRDLVTARRLLSASWGDRAPAFTRATGSLEDLPALPSIDAILRRLDQNPDLARGVAEVERRRALLELERAKAVPAPTLSGGIRRRFESDDNAFVAELTLPLPLLDRNSGGIDEARAGVAAAELRREADAVRTASALDAVHQSLASSLSAIEGLRTGVLPTARSALEAASEGYRHGKFGYLDLLGARRAWTEARGELLDTLADCHRTAVRLERLLGESLDAFAEDPR